MKINLKDLDEERVDAVDKDSIEIALVIVSDKTDEL